MLLSDPTYRRKATGRWEVIYYEHQPPDKRRRFKGGFRTRADAARWFAALRDRPDAPAALLSRTLGAFVADYLEHRAAAVRASTRALDASTLRRFVAHAGADTALVNLRPHHVETYLLTLRGRSGSPSAASANGELRRIRTAMAAAVRWGLLPAVPLAGVAPRREVEAPVVCLSPAEQAALVAGARMDPAPYLYPLVVLALRTGLRLGELLALRWCDADTERRQLTVRTTDGALTKSGRSRVVGLDADALSALAWWRDWFAVERAAALDRAADPAVEYHTRRSAEYRAAWLAQCAPAQLHPIFPSFPVAQLTPRVEPLRGIKRSWAGLVRRVFGARRVRFHDLRHTFAVQCARANVPLALLSQLLGHGDLATTQKYLRFYPDAGAAAVLGKVPALGVSCGHSVASPEPARSATPRARTVKR